MGYDGWFEMCCRYDVSELFSMIYDSLKYVVFHAYPIKRNDGSVKWA